MSNGSKPGCNLLLAAWVLSPSCSGLVIRPDVLLSYCLGTVRWHMPWAPDATAVDLALQCGRDMTAVLTDIHASAVD